MPDTGNHLDIIDQEKLRIFISFTEFGSRFHPIHAGKIHILRAHEIFEELFRRTENNARSRTVGNRITANRLQEMRFADARSTKKEERIHGTFHGIFRNGTAHGKRNAVRIAFYKTIERIIGIERSQGSRIFRKL